MREEERLGKEMGRKAQSGEVVGERRALCPVSAQR